MSICVGCGLDVVDGVVQVQFVEGGGLTCDDTTGLSVIFPAGYSPTESPDACNGFEVRGNGLYASCPEAIAGAHLWTGSEIAPLTVSTAGSAVFDWESDTVTVTNTTCRDVAGRISSRLGGVRLLAHDNFYCEAYVDVNIDSAGYAAASPDTTIVFENQTGSDVHTALNGFLDENYLAIAPGASHTYQARIHLHVLAATAEASGVPAIEFNWVLPQIGAC